MDIIQGGKGNTIAGAKPGDPILIFLITGEVERLVLSEISRTGIEGFQINMLSKPLTFYPYNNILKIKKHTEVT